MSDEINDYLQFRELMFHAVDAWTRDLGSGDVRGVFDEIGVLDGRQDGFLPRQGLYCAMQRLGANYAWQRHALDVLDSDDNPADKVRKVRTYLNLMAPPFDTPRDAGDLTRRAARGRPHEGDRDEC